MSRRERRRTKKTFSMSKMLIFFVVLALIVAGTIFAIWQSKKDDMSSSMPKDVPILAHPTPSSLEVSQPADLVNLWQSPDNRIKSSNGLLEIYQNTPEDRMEYRLYVSRSALDRLAEEVQKRGATTPTRIVIYGQSSSTEGKSDLTCEAEYGQYIGVVHFDQVNQFVAKNQPTKESRDLLTESQANLILFHEAGHIQNCETAKNLGLPVSDSVAENQATSLESEWSMSLPRIIFLKRK